MHSSGCFETPTKSQCHFNDSVGNGNMIYCLGMDAQPSLMNLIVMMNHSYGSDMIKVLFDSACSTHVIGLNFLQLLTNL